jgi:hypothetical protein
MPSAQVTRANNISIVYKIGADAQAGTAIGTSADSPATQLNCLARSYTRSTEIGTVEAGAFCDTEMKMATTRKSGTIEMEVLVPTTGSYPIFQGSIGYYVSVQAVINSSTTILDFGLITAASVGSEVDGIVTENVTITLGVSGIDSFHDAVA